jgi:hypothetical protein
VITTRLISNLQQQQQQQIVSSAIDNNSNNNNSGGANNALLIMPQWDEVISFPAIPVSYTILYTIYIKLYIL